MTNLCGTNNKAQGGKKIMATGGSIGYGRGLGPSNYKKNITISRLKSLKCKLVKFREKVEIES